MEVQLSDFESLLCFAKGPGYTSSKLDSTYADSVSTSFAGNFGQFVPSIIAFTARDPSSTDAVYGTGDELVIGFDRDTNRAGFGIGEIVSKTVVENLFLFSHGAARSPWLCFKLRACL